MFLGSVLIFMLSEAHISQFVPPLQLETKKGDANLNYKKECGLLDIISCTAPHCLSTLSVLETSTGQVTRDEAITSPTQLLQWRSLASILSSREAHTDERQIETVVHQAPITHVSDEMLNIFEKCCSLCLFFPL